MNLLQSFAVALGMLRLHKLRAFLTMLGVIIGVMSVTIIVMISSGFQYYMTNEFNKLGADLIMVMYDNWGPQNDRVKDIDGLRYEDVQYIKDRVSVVEMAAPVFQINGQKAVLADRTVDNPRLYGTDDNFLAMNRVKMTSGRFFTAEDVRNRANVCMIGEEIRDRLFPDKKPLGKLITFQGITLEVIGVIQRFDMMGDTNARDVYLPLTTAQDKWVGGDRLFMITARPKPGVPVADAQQAIWEALMLKSGNKRIYRVESYESMLEVFGRIFGVAGGVLAAVAALSLLVGGIGIMNIMLVSVTERTKEIGLRKAVGAKNGAILTQFLVEAGTLSLIGGMIGMAMAWTIGKGLEFGTAAMKWPSASGLPATFPVWAAVGAMLFSALIGVIFGLFPAISAARLDPIVALRTE
ncbi:MAG TPA: ABC transporter permease [Fimbriimonas sp.]